MDSWTRVSARGAGKPEIMKRGFKNVNLVIGGVLVLAILVTAGLSFFYTPYDPNRMNHGQALPISGAEFLLGTDQYGRDILSRVMKGAVNSLIVGWVAVGIGMGFGSFFGSLSAFWRGWKDEGVMRLMDVLYGFPAVLSAILITSILGPGMVNSMLAIGIFNIPIFTRLTRGLPFRSGRGIFVTSARAVGQRNGSIIWGTILPIFSLPSSSRARSSLPSPSWRKRR